MMAKEEKGKEEGGKKKGYVVVEVPLNIEDYVRLETVVIRKFGRKRGVFLSLIHI